MKKNPIYYGFHPTPYGECFIALTDRGLCGLSFINKAQRKEVLEDLSKTWGAAALVKQDQDKTSAFVKRIFSTSQKPGVKLLTKGTDFQKKVWQALLKIPCGKVVTYKEIAEMVGSPKAVRAVGNAVGRNSIAYLIPCHRVVRSGGALGGYRWGTGIKKAILEAEAAGRNAN